MISRHRRAIKASALVVIFSLVHVYLVTVVSAAILPQAITARLTTRGNQAIMVNGNPTTGGASILTGAEVATPDQVSATISLVPLGILEIAPNTKLKLEYSNGQIKVTLIEGCVILKVLRNTYGEIDNAQGSKITSNDATTKEAATLDVCYPPGAPAPIVNQGAAANAGAGAGVPGGGGGISPGVVGTVVGGGIIATVLGLVLANRGDNASPSS